MSTSFLVVAVSLGVIAVILAATHRQERRLRKTERRYTEKIATRDAISFRDFARKYFPEEDPEVVCGILDCVRQCATVPTDRLDPKDHMVNDLTIGVWDGLAPCRFDGSIGFPQGESADTLGQFISLCCRKLKESNPRVQSEGAVSDDGGDDG